MPGKTLFLMLNGCFRHDSYFNRQYISVEGIQLIDKFPTVIEQERSTLSSQNPSVGSILSQLNPLYTFTDYFCKIALSLQLRLGFPNFCTHTCIPHACYNKKRYHTNLLWDILNTMSHDSSVGIALGYGLEDWGSKSSIPRGGWEYFSSPQGPERLWGPPSLLSNGYQGSFPVGKAAGA
jgi:hypothetical protein